MNRSSLSTRASAALAALAVLLLVVAFVFSPATALAGGSRVATPGGSQGNPRVFPPQSMPYGLSYADWTVRWWQWAYGLPVAGHPLFDETGADCGAGQSGPVWFLGGVFNVSGSANRTLCSIPSGKAIFFPIINAEWDNFCPPTDPPLTLEQLRETVTGFMDLVTELTCELDGRPIENLERYRFAGDPFGIEMPDGNIWEFFGCPTPAGHYEPLVPDGFFLMLAPLSPGAHTLHFIGTVGDPINFTLDITYELTVTADGGSAIATPLDPAVGGTVAPAGSGGPRPTATSWGRMKVVYR